MKEQKTRSESGSKERPRVGIIVLTWKNYEDTAACLRSLAEIRYPAYDVIVVDNASNDGSGERLAAEFPWCEFIFNDRNLGYAGGNNVGIQYALTQGVEYVLLLNNDVIAPPDFLAQLVSTAETDETIAAVGGVIRHRNSDEIHNAGFRFSTLLGGQTLVTKEPRRDVPYETDYIPGALLLLRAEFISGCDVLNENYFFGMEDVDLAWQAREHGWRVVIDPACQVEHEVGETDKKSPFWVYHLSRNRLQFATDRLEQPERTLFYLSFFASHLLFSVYWLVKGERALARSVLLGVVDHVKNSAHRRKKDFD